MFFNFDEQKETSIFVKININFPKIKAFIKINEHYRYIKTLQNISITFAFKTHSNTTYFSLLNEMRTTWNEKQNHN